MRRFCLDTSAYSHFHKGHEGTARQLDAAEWIGVPAVTLGELRAGFLLGSYSQENEAQLVEFLANPVVDVLSTDTSVSLHYAEIYVDLRRAGTPLPLNDIWIAACAARYGATVLTFDRHFERIGQISAMVLRV